MSQKSILDKKRGMLLGLAIGDALGAAVEFKRPGSFAPVSGYRSGGPHGLDPGEWTDDTSMALALADSILETGWDLDDQARRYLSWWQNGQYSITGNCFDIGGTCSQALRAFQRLGNARESAPTAPSSSGNGSIMRIGPVPAYFSELYHQDLQSLVRLSMESSLPTHGSAMCLSACISLSVILAALINGESREAVLDPMWPVWSRISELHPLDPNISKVISGSFRKKVPPEIRGSGFVVESLEAALWAFDTSDSFEEAVLKAVNLGDDADTTGAVCGQLAGACWGESGISDHLLTGLAGRDMLDSLFGRLVSDPDSRKTSHHDSTN
ncbi:MAG: ADP-ribosyl-[dinitrogen reductase] glycohydrolase [Planctomycetota bacterium]